MKTVFEKMNRGRMVEYISVFSVIQLVILVVLFLANGSKLQKRVFSYEQARAVEHRAAEATAPVDASDLPMDSLTAVEDLIPNIPVIVPPRATEPTIPEAEVPEAVQEALTEPVQAEIETIAVPESKPEEAESESVTAAGPPGVIVDAVGGVGAQFESETQETAALSESGEEPEEETVAAHYRLVPKDFPIYSQLDYPDVRLGTGTVANNGCGITALAMVASYLTGHEYTPADLARYFGGRAENNLDRIEIASTEMKLPWRQAENWDIVSNALKSGCIVIQMENAKSRFTSKQHFLVLLGYTDDGLVKVLDPYLPNYDVWELKNGYANGFSPKELIAGFDGAWIYDPSAMRNPPFIYEPPARQVVKSKYPEIQLTDQEMTQLARLIFVEARGESPAGQQAVAEVVLNRLHSRDFPNSLAAVIYSENQFAPKRLQDEAEPSQAQYEAIENAILGPYVLPADVCYFSKKPKTNLIWGQIGGHYFSYEP